MLVLWVLGSACALNVRDRDTKIEVDRSGLAPGTMRDEEEDEEEDGIGKPKHAYMMSLLDGSAPATRAECLQSLIGGRAAVDSCAGVQDEPRCAHAFQHDEHDAEGGGDKMHGGVVLCEYGAAGCAEADTVWHYTCPADNKQDTTVVLGGDGCREIAANCGKTVDEIAGWNDEELRSGFILCCQAGGHADATCNGVAEGAFDETGADARAQDERFCHLMGDLVDAHHQSQALQDTSGVSFASLEDRAQKMAATLMDLDMKNLPNLALVLGAAAGVSLLQTDRTSLASVAMAAMMVEQATGCSGMTEGSSAAPTRRRRATKGKGHRRRGVDS